MAILEEFDLLKTDIRAWNRWRERNPEPELMRVTWQFTC